MRQRLADYILLLAVFLLPFQTQWIISETFINGAASEYGKLSIFAVEVLFVVVLLLRGRTRLIFGTQRVVQRLYFILAAGFFSLTLSAYYSVALFQLGHVLIASVVFMVLLDERTKLKDLVYAFLLGLIVPSLLGWYQYFSGFSPDSTLLGLAQKQVATPGVAVVETFSSRSLRAYGTFSHPNIFGGYLAAGILFLAWAIALAKEKWERVAVLFLTVLFSATLIITFSRSAWLSVSAALVVLILQMLVYKKMPPRKAYPVILFGLLTIVLTVSVFSSNVFARFQPNLRVEAISIQERFSQYDSVDRIIKLKPLFGVSPGGYVFALSEVVKGGEVWSYQPIHNSILLYLSEVGFLGLILLLYLFSGFYKEIKKVYNKPSGMFAVSFFVMFLVLAVFDHYLWSFWSGLILLAFGSAFALKTMLKDKNS